jgi:hypothetical protein
VFSLNSCHFNTSRTLLCLYSGVHLFALLAVFVALMPLVFKLLLIACVFISYPCYVRDHVLQSLPQSIIAITWCAEENYMMLTQKNNEKLFVNTVKQKAVLPFAVLLLCDVEERLFNQPVIIFKDGCSADDFRRLRVLAMHASLIAPN